MKRLTKRDSRGIPEIKGISESQRLCPKDRVLILDGVDRLAAYEDTGLEPETVGDLLERFNDLYAIFDDLDLVDRVHFQAFFDIVSCIEVRGRDYAVCHQGMEPCLKRDLWKTWFLTLQEAEEALMEASGDA